MKYFTGKGVSATIAVLFVAILWAGEAKADCHSCQPYEYGDICYSECGPYGACITNWDEDEIPMCEPLSYCPEGTCTTDGGGIDPGTLGRPTTNPQIACSGGGTSA